jgi:hypothetical protein
LKSSRKRSLFFAQHVFEVAQDHVAGVFSGTDEVIEKITGHKPMGLEEFIRKHRSAFDVSRAGLNLKGVLIMRRVELIHKEEARRINRSIHLKYVMPEALNDVRVCSYLTEGDDVTVKVHMDRLISWNLTDSNAGKALSVGGWFYPLNDELE